jgi:hypothetical protein
MLGRSHKYVLHLYLDFRLRQQLIPNHTVQCYLSKLITSYGHCILERDFARLVDHNVLVTKRIPYSLDGSW